MVITGAGLLNDSEAQHTYAVRVRGGAPRSPSALTFPRLQSAFFTPEPRAVHACTAEERS
jgi:hypothetical protein